MTNTDKRRVGRLARLALAGLVLLVTLSATVPEATGVRNDAEASAPMTVDRLVQRPIPKVCDFPVAHYVDGVHPQSPGPYDSFAEVVGAGYTADIHPLQAKIGDVTGNGVADGLLDVVCTLGGNTTYSHIFVYRSDGTRLGRVPVEQYAPSSTWPPQYPRATIGNGRIHVTVHTWRYWGAHCCPSRTTTLHFRLTGLKFVPA